MLGWSFFITQQICSLVSTLVGMSTCMILGQVGLAWFDLVKTEEGSRFSSPPAKMKNSSSTSILCLLAALFASVRVASFFASLHGLRSYLACLLSLFSASLCLRGQRKEIQKKKNKEQNQKRKHMQTTMERKRNAEIAHEVARCK